MIPVVTVYNPIHSPLSEAQNTLAGDFGNLAAAFSTLIGVGVGL